MRPVNLLKICSFSFLFFFLGSGLQAEPASAPGVVKMPEQNAKRESDSASVRKSASDPTETVQAMHNALCRGDFEAFDDVVDMDRAFGEIAAAEIADQTHLSTRERQRRVRFIVNQIKKEIRSSLQTEDYSVNCDAKAFLDSRDGDKARVVSRLPTREDRVVLLERSNGRWAVVSLQLSSGDDGNPSAHRPSGDSTRSSLAARGAATKSSHLPEARRSTWEGDPTGPLETARRIQEAACAGDDDEFMRFMDTRAVIRNSMSRILEQKGISPDSGAQQMLEEKEAELAAGLERKIRAQIISGKGGRDCRYRVRMIEQKSRDAVVEIQLQGGDPSHIFLEKRKSGLWIIINIVRPGDESDDIENSEHYV